MGWRWESKGMTGASTRWLVAGVAAVAVGLAGMVFLGAPGISGLLAPAASGDMMGRDPGRMTGQMLAGSAPQYLDSTKAAH